MKIGAGILPAGLPFRHPAAWLSTWFGAGLLPKAPGTWGSLAALPFAWGIWHLGGREALIGATVVVTLVGLWASQAYVDAGGGDDPGPVVIDEVAGQWIVLCAAAPDPLVWGIAFVLFRLFDIAKPWPVSWADKKLHGGLGIMLDDVLAGFYGLAILLAGLHFQTL